jgi:hypothetical protein
VPEQWCLTAKDCRSGARLISVHKYASDAVVAATALRSVMPVVILTSDADDMEKLCGQQVRIVTV